MVKFPWRSDGSGDAPEDPDDEGQWTSADTTDAQEVDPGEAGGAFGDELEVDTAETPSKDQARVTCEFQDGTLYVFEDVLCIERPGRSKFSEKWIALNQVQGVIYERRLVINYLQIEQVDFELSDEGMLSTPVDENTMHFGRGKRECAQRATDEILDRMAAE